MANEFIARNGVIALANSTISGSLSVTNSVSGSTFTGSFVGGLTGTSSYASFANTASFATLAYSASYFSGSISNAVFATSASFAATASYALNAGAGGGGTVGGQALLTQSLAATTWSFNHNLGTTYPVVTVYDGTSNTVIIPQNIVPSGSNDMKIYFSSPKSGYATAVAGGGYFVTNNGTTRKLVQSTPAVTWSFVHNIGDQYPAFEIYDSNNNIVIPANIRAVDTYTAEITFAYSASGTAVATLGGGIGVGDVITIPSASSAWSIQHNLNTTYPIVTIWESGSNQIVQPDTISSVDANNILVTFTTPVKGFANVSRAGSVISGSTDWNLLINKPNVGVVYSQTTPSSTWSIAHNLGTQFPLVTVYDSSNAVVIPQSIVGTDSNNITITFPTAQTGTVNVSRAGNYISGSILWSNITSGPFSTTGSVTNFTGSLNITGSLTVSGSGTFNNVGPANFTGSLNVTGSLNTIGTITATTLVVQTITSSISSITGSTKFGTLSSNTHQFTGSMFVTGGFYVTSGSVGLGTTNISAEANLYLGAQGTNEGGQLVLQKGTNYASASHLDNYQNLFRIMSGTDTTSSTVRMSVDMATGNVGIGTSSPTSKVTITDTGVYGSALNLSEGGFGAWVQGSTEGLTHAFIGNFKYNFTTPASSFSYYSGTGYGIDMCDGIRFFSAQSNVTNGTFTPTERMRITSGGKLLVGRTATIFTSSGNVIQADVSSGGEPVLEVYNQNLSDSSPAIGCFKNSSTTSSSARFIQFYSNGGTQAMGGIVGNGATNVQFASISDIREKENIVSIDGSLNKILALNPVEFDWLKTGEHIKAGFVAQQVEEVFPEYVVENMSNDSEEERKGLTGGMSSGIIAHLVKAIQELTARVQELENK